jgi:hypothetical protein
MRPDRAKAILKRLATSRPEGELLLERSLLSAEAKHKIRRRDKRLVTSRSGVTVPRVQFR